MNIGNNYGEILASPAMSSLTNNNKLDDKIPTTSIPLSQMFPPSLLRSKKFVIIGLSLFYFIWITFTPLSSLLLQSRISDGLVKLLFMTFAYLWTLDSEWRNSFEILYVIPRFLREKATYERTVYTILFSALFYSVFDYYTPHLLAFILSFLYLSILPLLYALDSGLTLVVFVWYILTTPFKLVLYSFLWLFSSLFSPISFVVNNVAPEGMAGTINWLIEAHIYVWSIHYMIKYGLAVVLVVVGFVLAAVSPENAQKFLELVQKIEKKTGGTTNNVEPGVPPLGA